MKKPVLKFCSHDVNQTLADRLHAHPYWQMEYIAGKSSIRLCDRNGECGEVRPGVFVLIPPLTPHRFLRSGKGTESYSLMYSAKQFAQKGKNSLLTSDSFCANLLFQFDKNTLHIYLK